MGKLRPGCDTPDVTEPVAGRQRPRRLTSANLNVRLLTLPRSSAWLTRPWNLAGFQGTGPGPSRSLPDRFPVSSLRRHGKAVARPPAPPATSCRAPRQTQVACSQALPPPPSPLCRLRPRPSPAVRLRAQALEPVGRLLTWACTCPRRLQWKGGASRSPRPLAAQPPRGSVAALADSLPLSPSRPRLLGRVLCARAPGRDLEGVGRLLRGQGRELYWKAGDGGVRAGLDGGGGVNSEKEGSGCHGLHTLPFWGCQTKVRKDCSRFPHFMSKCKSLEPSLTPSCHEPQQFLQSSTPFSNDHL